MMIILSCLNHLHDLRFEAQKALFTCYVYDFGGPITNEQKETLLSAYQNKQLKLWITKKRFNYKIIVCPEGGHIHECFRTPDFSANAIQIYADYYLKRFGFSTNASIIWPRI